MFPYVKVIMLGLLNYHHFCLWFFFLERILEFKFLFILVKGLNVQRILFFGFEWVLKCVESMLVCN